MAISARSVAHIRLTVTDIARSRQFYESVFGWPVAVEIPDLAALGVDPITDGMDRATLRRIVPAADILVVDDNSPDGTAGVVEELAAELGQVKLLRRPGKQGLGSAYKAGFAWAREHGYDTVLEMDADLSHDPADIPRLLEALRQGADAAVGSRYKDGVRVMNWPQDRLFLSLGASKFVQTLTKLPLTDVTSGFKAIRCRALQKINWDLFRAEGYGEGAKSNRSHFSLNCSTRPPAGCGIDPGVVPG